MNVLEPLRRYLWLLLIVLCAVVAWSGAGLDSAQIEEQGHYGFLSLVPALSTLVICFITRNVILALFMGVLLGGLVTTEYNIIQAFLIPSVGSERYAVILLVYLWALGGLLGMWNRNGGALHFAQYVSDNYVKTRRSALVFAWVMGVIFHQGGTISTILTGTTVRPVADRERVAHEELAYVVDSTASPVATIIPFNAWPLYIAGLIVIPSTSQFIADEADAISWFVGAIPFNFYGILAVTFTLLFALDKLPFVGKTMRRAQRRARETGELDSPHAEPVAAKELTSVNVADGYKPSLLDFFTPIVVLISLASIPWIIIGELMIEEAFGLALISSIVLSVMRGMKLTEAFDGLVTGIKGVTIGAIILGGRPALGGAVHPAGCAHDHLHDRVVFGRLVVGDLRRRVPDRAAARLRHLVGSAVRNAGLRRHHGRRRVRRPVLADLRHDGALVAGLRLRPDGPRRYAAADRDDRRGLRDRDLHEHRADIDLVI